MELENISADSDWGSEAAKTNRNNQKIVGELQKQTLKVNNILYFKTSGDLIANIPNPNSGQQAWAGTPYPGTVWSATGGG